MNSAVGNSVFSLPLRHLNDPIFDCDQVLTESTVRGLSRYIGDQNNALLRFFADEIDFQPTDWPLFLHGPTGTAKTSLALTIVSGLSPESSVISMDTPNSPKPIVLSAPDFTRRFNSAIETDSVPVFRQRLAESQALLIDNVHLLENKKHAQDELISVIDELTKREVPIIVTSLFAPHALPNFSAQLVSRLINGLSFSLNPPGKLARCEILTELAKINSLKFDADTTQWLCEKLCVSVPKMNQFLNQVKLTVNNLAQDKPLNIAFFEELLEGNRKRSIDEKFRFIVQKVAKEFHLKPGDLKTNSRKQSIVMARGVAVYLCRTLLKSSFKQIGEWFGGRDHSTAMHAYNKINKLITSDDSTPVKTVTMQLRTELEEEFNGLTNKI